MARTTTGTTTEVAPPAGPARSASSSRRPALSVRTRITAAVSLLVALALAGAGLIAAAIQEQRLERQVVAAVDQEFEEFEILQRQGVNPETGRRYENAAELLLVFLERNVPDPDEMLIAWWDGEPKFRSPVAQRELTEEPGFQTAVRDAFAADRTWFEHTSPEWGDLLVTTQTVGSDAGDGVLIVVKFLDEAARDLRQTMVTYALVAALAWLAVTAIAAWQSGRLLAPLRVLREATADVTASDLSRRIPEQGNDDITALTRTINDMLDRLESGFGAQRQFLDDAGHELKTPLTIMSGHLELLRADDAEEVETTRALVLDEVDRMSRLVGELLLLAKSRRPDFVQPGPVDLDSLFPLVLAKVQALGDREWHLDEVASGVAHLDEQRVTQALVQLCENAVKHTEPGDVVAIGSAWAGAGLDLWVRDSGPGVPVEDRAAIFERFERSQVRESDEGFGLGLSIVRAIAEAHGGSAAVADAPGGGALFAMTFPRAGGPN